MNKDRKDRIAELRWTAERESNKSKFLSKIDRIVGLDAIEILDFELSDRLMDSFDAWPSERHGLTYKIPKDNPDDVATLLLGS